MAVAISKEAPKRPAFRFPGAKWRDAKYVLEHVPADHDVWVEVFGGSFALGLKKARSPIEVYNDKSYAQGNYLRVLRDRPGELIRLIQYTPFSRRELDEALACAGDDELRGALAFYVRAMQSIAGPATNRHPGFRRQKVLSRKANGTGQMRPAVTTWNDTDHLWVIADRLRGVVFEMLDAVDCIELYGQNPRAVLYADPPYLHSERESADYYEYEMTPQQHIELAVTLRASKAMVLLSGYSSPLYQSLYPDWQKVEWKARTNGNSYKQECLWLNPATVKALALERERKEDRFVVERKLERWNAGLGLPGDNAVLTLSTWEME